MVGCSCVTIVLAILLWLAVLAGGTPSYKAAVVEFNPEKWYDLPADRRDSLEEAKALKLRNLEALSGFAQDAKHQGADIMVFSEYGFTGDNQGSPSFDRLTSQPYLEELPELGSVPCDANETVQSNIAIVGSSCLARKLHLYLVININTREPCAERAGCPSDGMKIHNTMIAFSRRGELMSSYNKVHPWGKEKFLDPGSRNQQSSFTTDFGVKFGMLICFDLLFPFHADDATDFAFATDWENHGVIPGVPRLLTARNSQRVWSRLHSKNLLAANYGGNGRKSSGSGIWHEGKELTSYYNPSTTPQSKVLVADMPIIQAAIVQV